MVKIESKDEFEYDPSEFQAYAFTVKKLGPACFCSIDDYRSNVLLKWSRLGVMVEEPYFEEDKDGKLHMHGIVSARKNYYRKKLSVFGYHVYITDIWDVDKWIEYCSKVKKTITINNTEYLF